jgi:hypothetical protein
VPHRFSIIRVHAAPRGCAAIVHYPDATSREGRKILVLRGVTGRELRRARTLDPHFHTGALAPFARFEPTDDGWAAATALADSF